MDLESALQSRVGQKERSLLFGWSGMTAALGGCSRAPRSGVTKGILLVHRPGGESLGKSVSGHLLWESCLPPEQL